MKKQIPIYFDSVIVSSPLQQISETNQNLGRLQVRVFTRYGNRNGSYITSSVADQLIKSAVDGMTPVIGFFDPSSQSWASHTGPTLANAYGYVESFVGWQPFQDTDGVTRDYAVFSVVLFTKYFEEAKKVLGQNQSMELNPDTITGDWARIGDEEYFVYKTAEMLGFCIIGEHEPCFSVSSFFSKNDDSYDTQYEKFSSLLSEVKAQVEDAQKGGEQPMNEFENQEVVESEVTPVEEVVEFTAENEETVIENEEAVVEEPEADAQEGDDAAEESNEFDLLQQKFNELQASYNELNERLDAALNRVSEYEALQSDNEALRAQNQELQASLQNYEAMAIEAENARKNELIEKYEKVISEEEVAPIRDKMSDYSYEELESKLAIAYANATMNKGEEKKVPLPEPKESTFALLMKKYRKN